MTTLIAAIPVAFTAQGEVDREQTRRALALAAASRIDAGFVLGTTGEFPSLTAQERADIARVAIEELGPERTVVHVGAADAHSCIGNIDAARRAGARRIAILTPYYLPASPAALQTFFTETLQAAEGLESYIYLFRDRTGITADLDTLGAVFRMPGVVGTKVSGESLPTVAQIAHVAPADFQVLTGADVDLGAVGSFGLQGVVSGLSSAVPEPFDDLRVAVDRGDAQAARRAQARVDDVAAVLRGDIRRIKAALVARGILSGSQCRMALDELDGIAEIEAMLARVL